MAGVTRVSCTCTYSQLLLEALDLGLQCLCVLRLSLTGGVAGVSQLGETTQSLLQSLNICQQLCDLKHDRTNIVIPNPRNKTDPGSKNTYEDKSIKIKQNKQFKHDENTQILLPSCLWLRSVELKSESSSEGRLWCRVTHRIASSAPRSLLL